MRLALSILLCSSLAVVSQAQAQEQTAAPEAHPTLYVLEGVNFSRVRGELSSLADGLFTLQLGVGYQPESSLWSYELFGRFGGTLDHSTRLQGTLGWGLRAKRFHPISRHVQLYGRIGVSENFLMRSAREDLAGFGFEYGAGVQGTVKVRALGFFFFPAFFMGIGPKVDLSLWADLGGEVGNLHDFRRDSGENYNYRLATGGYGVSVGGQF